MPSRIRLPSNNGNAEHFHESVSNPLPHPHDPEIATSYKEVIFPRRSPKLLDTNRAKTSIHRQPSRAAYSQRRVYRLRDCNHHRPTVRPTHPLTSRIL